jgi:hypothetical protein
MWIADIFFSVPGRVDEEGAVVPNQANLFGEGIKNTSGSSLDWPAKDYRLGRLAYI